MTASISSENIFKMCPCAGDKTYGESPLELINYYESLPKNRYGDLLRIMAIPYLYHATEAINDSATDAIEAYSKAVTDLLSYVKTTDVSGLKSILELAQGSDEFEQLEEQVETHTGQHYGNLFKGFSDHSYFNEAKELLKTRLERNGIEIENLKNKTVLDQGCGGGRYTVAWSLLGAKECTGVDLSDIGLEDATKRVEAAKIKNVSFVKSTVLNLPFEDDTFDIVYSNGVLHHTTDWKLGIAEQIRVLKPGGFGWQYLIENPGGIQWDSIEILRVITRNVNKNFARTVMKLLGIPANRIFFMLDHVMVPINDRLTPMEIENELILNGAKNIKRLERGADFDGIEKIYNKIPFAEQKFGVGENRFIFTK
ncbi:MAG: methyltransferase domain-containing protein [Bacteroidia bacterium]|nr:methyltransferase domain-containing protein [Bacteroidia bacterium]